MIYSSFVFIVMLVLLGEKIVVPNIIQCFLSSQMLRLCLADWIV